MQEMGFFTDTTLCIGCKACEVACKQWNQLPDDGFSLTGMSYDNTGALGASTWRHVAFVERTEPLPGQGSPRDGIEAGAGAFAELRPLGQPAPTSLLHDVAPTHLADVPAALGPSQQALGKFSWLMMSDVCKHCERAGCLEACPTGAILRTEFGSVYIQPDVCNGCGYCVSACPFGVVDRREDDGRAWKCTLCYDRLEGGMVPACAKACPTASIQFGPLEDLRERARTRVEQLRSRGVGGAHLYGESAQSQPGTEGLHAFFLLCDRPEVYGLPPDPVVPTAKIVASWRAMATGVLSLAALALGAVLSARRA
ncbi:4Fe-4S dicluster domain-containing protein [Anaeromyxobacter sp. PSR-1]|uniref:4Fe-4S dicluster domain-containing protein n=1 Tax=unclassified Anaeromyxobacter TaxID=2620896 RepID=UPI0005E78724|nr:4Fe-4S dicluster domain-containing protein [Anaeromyxobacter sp. PSR-1]GAO01997.1 formate dehydrogenase-O iron-sulfur subunit [Anaeromyxobacter sp. PSR-1]